MIRLSTIIIMFVSLILGVFIGIGVKTVAVQMDEKAGDKYIEQQQPKKIVVITFDETQQDEFFTQIREFSDKWNYAIRVAPANSFSSVYLVQMWREDIKVIATNNYGAGRFSVAFFDTYPQRPVPDQFFEEEIEDLENFINNIPGATFVVEK